MPRSRSPSSRRAPSFRNGSPASSRIKPATWATESRKNGTSRSSAARVTGTKVEYDYSINEQEHGFSYHPEPTGNSGTGTLDLKQIGPVFQVVSSGWSPPYRGGRRPGTFTYSGSAARYCSGFCLVNKNSQEYVNSMFMFGNSEDANQLALAFNRLAAFAQSPEGVEDQQEREGKAIIRSH